MSGAQIVTTEALPTPLQTSQPHQSIVDSRLMETSSGLVGLDVCLGAHNNVSEDPTDRMVLQGNRKSPEGSCEWWVADFALLSLSLHDLSGPQHDPVACYQVSQMHRRHPAPKILATMFESGALQWAEMYIPFTRRQLFDAIPPLKNSPHMVKYFVEGWQPLPFNTVSLESVGVVLN